LDPKTDSADTELDTPLLLPLGRVDHALPSHAAMYLAEVPSPRVVKEPPT
jgi:hypothetical protein